MGICYWSLVTTPPTILPVGFEWGAAAVTGVATSVLVAYAIVTVASWRLEWLTRRWVAVAMIGALLPDLNRIGLFVTDTTLEAVLGVPFGVDGIHTLGGVLVLAGVGSMILTSQHRRAFGMLLAGALSHLLVDGIKAYADGAAGAWLYPFTWYRPPTPNLYISSDPAILIVTAVAAGLVLIYDRLSLGDGQPFPT